MRLTDINQKASGQPVSHSAPSQNLSKLEKFHSNCLLLALILYLGLTAMPSTVNAKEINIAIRAHNGANYALQRWNATIDYLNEKIPQHHFNLIPVVSLEELKQRSAQLEFDFILTNPSNYIEMSLTQNAGRILTLINKRQGQGYTHFGSVIFTRADQKDINNLQDLKGKRLLAVSETAFGGWRVAWLELLNNDIDPYSDLAELKFADGIQKDVVFGVLSGHADVGVVRTDMLERLAAAGKIDLSSIRILGEKHAKDFGFLHSTELYPEWPLVKHETASPELAKQVTIALLQLDENHPAAQQGQYVGWSVPLDYSPVHDLIKKLKIGPYQSYGEITPINIMQIYWPWFIGILALFTVVIFTAAHFIRLNRRLKETSKKLDENRKELEQRVIQRTAELDSKVILLDSISSAQTTFINHAGLTATFNHTLEGLLKLTESEYGFIGEIIHGQNTQRSLKTHAVAHMARNEATQRFFDKHKGTSIEFSKLESLYGSVITSGETVISNHPANDLRYAGIPGDHPLLECFLGIPIFSGNELVGIIGLANRNQGYHKEIAASLSPIATTCANLITAHRMNRQAKQAEKQIRFSETKHRAVLDNMSDALININEKGIIVTCNQAAEKIFDYRAEQLIGQNINILMDGQQAHHHDAYLRKYHNSGEKIAINQDRELRAVHRDGSTFPIEISVNEVLVGEQRFFSGLIRDITGRKQAENALLESRRMLQVVLDTIPVRVFWKNLEGTYLGCNKLFAADTGLSSATDVLGKTDFELPWKKQADSYRASDLSVIGTGQPNLAFQHSVIDAHGNFIWLEMNKIPLTNHADEIIGILGTYHNITEHKKALESVKQSAERLNKAQRIAHIGSWEWYPKQDQMSFSDEAYRLFAFNSHDEVKTLQQSLTRIHESDRALVQEKRQIAASAQQSYTLEYQVMLPDGGQRTLLEQCEVVKEESKVIATMLDITERKKIDQMKNEFISTVSHELRTPLTSIRGSLGLLLGGVLGELSPKVNEFISLANKNTERLLLLINDILDIEKIESGKMQYHFSYLNVQEFLQHAIDTHQGYADEHQIKLILNLNHLNKESHLYGDSDRLMQVMSNLLSNAIKFSPSGETVEISLDQKENSTQINVTDHGPGIPQSFHEQLFDKFTQSDSSDTRQVGGTGLGLHITKAIVEQHGGNIGFVTEEGAGTTLFVDLPNAPQIPMAEDHSLPRQANM